MAPANKNGEKKPPKNKKNTTKKSESATESADEPDPFGIFQSVEQATEGGKKRLSIEQIYQKKTQLEHILLRPSTYIGSVDRHTENMWIYDEETERMISKPIAYVPGLYKIYDEIVVNAADNKQRDPSMNKIKIDINPEKNEISVWNNGRGIPVVEHKVEKVYVPELIFGTLLTSSNYDDSENRLTGGLNGFGAKLCNIFSTKFTVETSSKQYRKAFKQTWRDNMAVAEEAVITPSQKDDFTCVTFSPDVAKFGLEKLDEDCVALMSRRAYDLAGSTNGVTVYLNGKKLPIKGFKEYIDLYMKNTEDEKGEPFKVIFDQPHERWQIAATVSGGGSFQQISFVNSIATTKGGRHVDFVSEKIVEKLLERIKSKLKKTGMNVRPAQVKNHLWLFVNCLIVNPTFDSQTKENMTLQSRSFGSKFELGDKFLKQIEKSPIVDNIINWLTGKAQQQLLKQCHSTKRSKIKGIPKLDDANDAGTKDSPACTLILTEGDSAKALAVSGLGEVGRDKFGVYPLRGKVLNVREASFKQIKENKEINELIRILGLNYGSKYETATELKTLRYGKVMIMTDQDQDGSHIKGLLINFIHHNWPALLRHDFVEEFITPIVKVSRGKQEPISFYSIPEYEEWKAQTNDWNKWKIKYYKGLGTSDSKEAKEYFTNMRRHQIKFKYGGEEDDKALYLAFSKKRIEERKEWLSSWMEERKRRQEEKLPDVYLYEKDTTAVTYKDFIDKELVLFSNMDNERSIPSLVDGLKPGQRKVMFTCFRRNDKNEVKVAQLAGSVAEMSAYHHGEQSLMSTIINLAQNFVGSNNLNLLLPNGQFGTRLQGGKDAASPRYIFTMLNHVTRTVFHESDEPLLRYMYDDNKKIEPEYYCPIIPTVLINGADGIGTGWSTKVPCYNPRDVVENIKRLINGQDLLPMTPWYKNYRGTIVQLGPQRYLDSGEIAILDDDSIEITELPHDVATQSYKEQVLEPMLNGTEKQAPVIQDYREYHTDTTVRFVVKLSREKLESFQRDGLHKAFKLQSSITLSSMVLFDANGCLKKYDNVEDIIKQFYVVRTKLYEKRHAYMIGFLEATANRMSNQARFILEVIDEKVILKKKKRDIVKQLKDRNYDPDPVQVWKEQQAKKEGLPQEEQQRNDEQVEEQEDEEAEKLGGYDYLVKMELLKLSEEEVAALLRKRDTKFEELEALRRKKPRDLWLDDLQAFLDAMEKQERKEAEGRAATAGDGSKRGAKSGKARKSAARPLETTPSPGGQRIVPVVDAATKEKYEKADKLKEQRTAGVKRKNEDDEPAPLIERVKRRLFSGESGQSVFSGESSQPLAIYKDKDIRMKDLAVSNDDESVDKEDRPRRADEDDDDDDAYVGSDVSAEMDTTNSNKNNRSERPARARKPVSYRVDEPSDDED